MINLVELLYVIAIIIWVYLIGSWIMSYVNKKRSMERILETSLLDAHTDFYDLMTSVCQIYYNGHPVDVLEREEDAVDFVKAKMLEHLDRIKEHIDEIEK